MTSFHRSRALELRDAAASVLGGTLSTMSMCDIIDAVAKIPLMWHSPASVEDGIRTLLPREARKERGMFVRIDRGQYDLRQRVEDRLRSRIWNELEGQGLQTQRPGSAIWSIEMSKESLRAVHRRARHAKYLQMRSFVEEREPELLEYFADGTELNVDAFAPRIQVVASGTPQNDLFRYASLLWSVPVSGGFGRRVRFLVWDDSSGKLVGLFALGDPVFNLRCRDQWIGWNAKQREDRLYNVMDIFILGAVPPYNQLLGGKLVAMLAASNEVREFIARRYRDRPTVLQHRKKNSRLALLTTGSALGRSSVYDRIKYGQRLLYQRLGNSQGWGHFHLNSGLFEEMRAFVALSDPKRAAANRFGNGPNWKIRVARQCLKSLELSPDLLRHGISREIYGIPLARNFRQFLCGEHQKIQSLDLPSIELTEYFRERWMRGRALRKPEYKEHRKSTVSVLIHSAREQG